MANIKLLTPEVYNLISAGEVIENPVGVIKELVENGIDAGATRINIEVQNGGFDLISVTDNGCGIREDDIETAFLKHATSKLRQADDLYSVETLGFRGEALPSISAVSRIKLTTRHAGSETATSVYVENSAVITRDFVSANIGTKIEVRDLFYNTPARRKFLKAPSREALDITKFVARLILINPNLAITYILDGNKVYQTNGGGLEEAIFAIYGADCLSQCIKISYSSNSFYRITGYIGTPEYSKPNKTYQTLSVNGRYIKDESISGAIMQAYRPYLMQRNYPFYVLNLDIPCDKIDVNVHPKKIEVRFEDAKSVNSAFYHAVCKALNEFSLDRINSILSSDDYEREPVVDDTAKLRVSDNDGKFSAENLQAEQDETVRAIERSTLEEDYKRSFEKFLEDMDKNVSVESMRRKAGLTTSGVAQSPSALNNDRTSAETTAPPIKFEKDEVDEFYARAKILGIAFKTYLIIEIDDKIMLIDQHAAHERVLFDKFMSGQSKDMQPLLFPYVFNVKDDEAQFIDDNLENILSAGIEIEPFGRNTYRITSVSSLLADTDMEEFVRYLLSSVDEFKLDDRVLVVEKVAKKACKAAVKAGYTLNEYEIRHILKEISENRVLQCPHGRPINVIFKKKEIEKMFKRIV